MKTKTNHIKFISLFILAILLLLFGIFIASNSYMHPIKIVYAAEPIPITNGEEFFQAFYSGSQDTVTGDYFLANDITLDYSANNSPNSNALKRTLNNVKFDGDGHTITVIGTKTLNYTHSGDLNDEENISVGLLFGNLNHTQISNLNVIFAANINVTYSNNSKNIGGNLVDSTIVSRIHVGLLAGSSSVSSSITDVKIETKPNSRLVVEGIDNMSGTSDLPMEGFWPNYIYPKSIQDRAVSATVSLVVGISNDFTANNVSIKHDGLVVSRSHSKVAGITYESSRGEGSKTHVHISDYGSQAGLFVGLADTESKTKLNCVLVEGSGAVVALLKGGGSSSTSHIFNDSAGILSGKNFTDISWFNVEGLIYKYNGLVVGSTGSGFSRKSRLLVGDTVDTKTSIKYMFRDNSTNNAIVSSYNQVNVGIPSSASGVRNDGNVKNNKRESRDNYISQPNNDYLGFNGILASTTTNIEVKIPVYDGNNINADRINNATVSYSSFEKVSSNPLKYQVKICVDLGVASEKYLSALKYQLSGDPNKYISVYSNKAKSYDFYFNLDYGQLDAIFTCTITSQDINVDYKIDSNKYNSTPVFEYNGENKDFNASLSGSSSFSSSLRWYMTHTPVEGYPEAQQLPNSIDASSNLPLQIPKTAGIYNFVLKKYENDIFEDLQDGDVIAGNSVTHPSEIYVYNNSFENKLKFKLEINQKVVTLENGTGTLSREYDGTTNLGTNLIRNVHYKVQGIISGDEFDLNYEHAEFSDKSVGDNKEITITGITLCGVDVNGTMSLDYVNYKTTTNEMRFTSGKITKRKLDFVYSEDSLGQLGDDGAYSYNYIGAPIIPQVEPSGVVSNEDVSLSSKSYLSNNSNDTIAVDAVDVGTYYFRLTLSGSDSNNYELREGFEITSRGKMFRVVAKVIDVVWEINGIDILSSDYIPLVYNGNEQNYAVTNSSEDIYNRDKSGQRELEWTYIFRKAATNEVSDFRDAITYKVEASLVVKETTGQGTTKEFQNYIINASTKTANISIEKFAFTLAYKFNEALFSELTYNATDLKPFINAVQVTDEEPRLTRAELNKVNLNYYVDDLIVNSVKDVGTYKISPTYTSVNPNFKIKMPSSEFVFNVKPKTIKITIPQKEFVYRGEDIKSKITYERSGIENSDLQNVSVEISIPNHSEITNVGQYEGTVIITGSSSNNYKPEIWEDGAPVGNEVKINVIPYDLSAIYSDMPSIEISRILPQEFRGEAITPNVNVRLKKGNNIIETLYLLVDYNLTYSDNVNVGEAIVKIIGNGNYTGEKDVNFDITKRALSFTYTGNREYVYNSFNLKENITFEIGKSLSSFPASVVLSYFYKADGESNYSEITENEVVNSGSYYVENSLNPEDPNNANYELISEAFYFDIKKKDVSVTFSNYTNLVFDDNVKTINCNFTDENQLGENDKNDDTKISISLSYTKLTKQGTSISPENLINASKYFAKANLIGTASNNYKLIDETIYQEFYIEKLVVSPDFSINGGEIIYDTLDKKDQIIIENSSSSIPEIDKDSLPSWYIRQFRRVISQGVYSDVLISVRDAGRYRLEVSLPTSSNERASNYTVEVSKRFFEFEILKTTITSVFTKDGEKIPDGQSSWEYNAESLNIGTKLEIPIDNNASLEAKNKMKEELSLIQFSPNFYSIDMDGNETFITSIVDAGEYVAKIDDLEGTLTNYVLDENINKIFYFQITKKTISNISWGQGVADGIPYNAQVREITPSSQDIIGSDNIFGITAYYKKLLEQEEIQIDVSEIKNAGLYRIELSITNVNYKFFESVDIQKIFEIKKMTIQYTPLNREIVQEFGMSDLSYSYVHRVTHGSIFEDITVTLTREPGEDVRTENNGIYPFKTATSSNDNYEINLVASNEYGVRIVKYKHNVNPKIFSKEYDGSYISPELKETITVNLPNFVEITFNLIYTVPIATNAAYYDLLSYDWEKVDGNDHPHKKNIEVIIDPVNMENKYQILPKKISIDTPEDGALRFIYGDNVYVSQIYDYLEIINPEESVGDGSANDSYEKKGQYFDISLNDSSISELEQGHINFNDNGYLLSINMKSTNYVSDLNSEVRLYIDKRPIKTKYEINLSLNKIYDGTDKVIIEENLWKNSEVVDSVAILRGLSVRARFSNKDAGANKTIFVEYFVDNRYANNFDLLSEYELEQTGEILAKEIEVAFNVDERQSIYGDNFDLYIQPVTLVGNETLESQNINISLYTEINENIVPIENIKNVGIYNIKVKVENNDQNYIFTNSNITARLIIQKRNIGIQAGNEYVKYEDGTVDVDISQGGYYKFTNVIESDLDKLFIDGYSAELLYPSHDLTPNAVQVRNIKLKSIFTDTEDKLENNYILNVVDVLTIPAKVLPIYRDLILNEKTVSFDNKPKEIEASVSLAEGATLHLSYDGESTPPINAGRYRVTSFVKRGDYEIEGPATNLIIEKVNPIIEFSGNFRQEYGSFTEITAKAKSPFGLNENAIISYSFDSQNLLYAPAGENHIVYAKFEENTNYNAATQTRKLVIKPKAVTISFSNYDNIVYNGKDQKENILITVNGAMEDDLFKPYKVFSPNEVKDAGDYSVVVSSRDPNYTITGVSSLNFRVKKANLTVVVKIDDTVISEKPRFIIEYEGFFGNDDVTSLEKEPVVIISQSKLGENIAIPQVGQAQNYDFVFKEEKITYNVTSSGQTNVKSANLPYIVIGGVLGLTVIILVFSFFARKRILRKAIRRKK
ncbi:MAG TPA: hypothetical protein GX709_01165 [Clostridiales bacterium]|nr:hypothetical protein [Clostridiales bacterium]